MSYGDCSMHLCTGTAAALRDDVYMQLAPKAAGRPVAAKSNYVAVAFTDGVVWTGSSGAHRGSTLPAAERNVIHVVCDGTEGEVTGWQKIRTGWAQNLDVGGTHTGAVYCLQSAAIGISRLCLHCVDLVDCSPNDIVRMLRQVVRRWCCLEARTAL